MRYDVIALAVGLLLPNRADAWGDQGRETVAIIAESLLHDDVRPKVFDMLASDRSPLTEHDMASEATWARQISR